MINLGKGGIGEVYRGRCRSKEKKKGQDHTSTLKLSCIITRLNLNLNDIVLFFFSMASSHSNPANPPQLLHSLVQTFTVFLAT